jgi:1-acyl-sn-glycerol-3-phosphate acyltransferase
MWRIRSLLFDFFFYVGASVLLILGLPFVWKGKRQAVLYVFKILGRMTSFLLRWIVGLDFKTLGLIFPQECIIACRHQSAWETLLVSYLFGDVFIVVKKELTRIPVFGIYVKMAESIIVDRGNAMSAARSLVQQTRNKTPIFIFPEGTRAEPHAPVQCQHGIYVLYKEFHLPVYPVTLNSGLFWERRAFFKKPGTIHVKALEPIPVGLKRHEFMEKLEQALNTSPI